MNEPIVQQNTDELLLPFLRATDEAQTQSLLAQLVGIQAAPIIKKIINSKLSFSTAFSLSDADDVQSEATIHLLSRLKECKADPQNKTINDFRNYTAVTAYRACYAYLRRKFPERHKLKNRLRYLHNHNDDFAIWENLEGKFLCGFAGWQGRGEAENKQLAEFLSYEEAQQANLAEILTLFYKRCDAPVEIDELVNVLADRLELTDAQVRADSSVDTLENLADLHSDIAEHFDRQLYMRKLWQEICDLPIRQRIALLLNLKDEKGRGCIALFQLTGIATMRQMAEVMEMTIEKLANIWNELPMEDAKIADLLSLTRQQIINLRKSARERLARRLKMF